MKLQTAKRLINTALKKGGLTANLNGREVRFKRGYQVASTSFALPIATQGDLIRLGVFTNLLSEANVTANNFIGFWVDNDKIYIDLSQHIKSLPRALSLGQAFNQQTIFSWANSECLPCFGQVQESA